LARRLRPSIFSICARNDSMAGSGRKRFVDLQEQVYHVPYLFSFPARGVKAYSMPRPLLRQEFGISFSSLVDRLLRSRLWHASRRLEGSDDQRNRWGC
jgi:hypothetical protein